MFYELSTKTKFTNIQDFRLAHRDTSFGELDTEQERNHFGLFTLVDERPPYDAKLYTLEKGPIEELEGKFVQTYVTKELPLTRIQKAQIFSRRLEDKLYDHYDAVARGLGWDDRKSILSRAGFPNHYRAEAEAFGKWMGDCDLVIYRIINELNDGVREIPHGPEFFIRGLPKFESPKE